MNERMHERANCNTDKVRYAALKRTMYLYWHTNDTPVFVENLDVIRISRLLVNAPKSGT